MARFGLIAGPVVAAVTVLTGCAIVAGGTSGYSEPPSRACTTTSDCAVFKSSAGASACCWDHTFPAAVSAACSDPGVACSGGGTHQLCDQNDDCGTGGTCTLYKCVAPKFVVEVGTCGDAPCAQ